MGVDSGLHIFGEVAIRHRRVAELPLVCSCQSDAFADPPARTLRRFDNSHRTMVLLHDDLHASLHFLQYGVGIAGECGFCDADRHFVFDRSTFGRTGSRDRCVRPYPHTDDALRYSSCLPTCAYCSLSPDDAWLITEHVAVVPHPNPLTPCHVVIAPRRHVAAFYDLDVQEQRMIWDVVGEIQKRIASALKVEGFDVGFADAPAGDAGTTHAHVHVVPRTPGASVALPCGIEWVDVSS